VGLAINSSQGRSQQQLHIHIDCLREDVIAALKAAVIGPAWAPLPTPLSGHPYRARWLPDAALAGTNPFKLLAAAVGADAMAQQTLVVAGAVSHNGEPGFVLLADQADMATGDHASGAELEDHSCAVLNAGAATR
jgi:CDP-diacylglycerol pyrophosphatase